MDMPPAPTPPMNGGLGPNSERNGANLLNLLKFSTGNRVNAPQSQQSASMPPASQSPLQQSESHREHELRRDNDDDNDDDDEEDDSQYQHQQNSHQQHQQQQSMIPQIPAQFPTPRIHQPAPAAADPKGLLAALIRGTHDIDDQRPTPPPQSQAQPQVANPFAGGSPTTDPSSLLLKLLNPKPSQTDKPMMIETSRSNNDRNHQSTESPSEDSRYHGSSQQPRSQYHQQQAPPPSYQQTESFGEIQHPSANPNQFSYTQIQPSMHEPADRSVIYQQLMTTLNQSSPQHHSAPGSAHGSGPPSSFHILKKDQGSPAGSNPYDPARLAQERSPLQSPPQPQAQTIRRSIDRTSSLHSHNSHHSAPHSAPHSAHPSAKQTPLTSEFDSFVKIEKNKEAVSDAIHDLAGQADRDAQDALDRAEHDAKHDYSGEAESPSLKHEDSEWVHPSGSSDAVQSLETQIIDDLKTSHEHGRHMDTDPPSYEDGSQPTDADELRGVADNWESAEQEEIVVIEDKEPSVRVFNFPMKPWISITLRENATEPRPEFKDESIMDIARLRKDFDQIDRNLYTASQTYMTYGMSKQGGLRVIRQEDGKDAKIFTDTKDRIFNVAMSVTPPEYEGGLREAIIGTGISGTVYWVQIKEGEKDHIDDPHLEQYGFALPPINSQDGDAPGGALKTRARASTIHPEFFAVGRGKSINFIWPHYVLQNKLFKPGHDRVADTEALLERCSLKINTGKAGKDFTFSQDDSVVVSLDKSGRVKFWDIRQLTEAREGSDPRAPMPAHSSIEVKDPLMTLASTPEGEKAWPTSVLLLDKLRPYQKRCALRYMIVGMKQNHTLQLWDLALGKPVQEFNLPHSKESDAVCSVMYHPTSGMIIIGHPTRNSVYFAHLSAPKYNLKNVSQAEYIERLVAQDPTIPQPDSTAVISGVREYSFANRGILRSLDILTDPAMMQESDEPTLFELYAMHSKGVACLLIKRSELGWSKDNKVLEPVDAVTEGVVTVSKLKPPQQAEVATTASTAENGPIRIAHRTANKEATHTPPSSIEPTQRVPEALTPVKPKVEPKEVETPVNSSKEGQSEKHERKTRKKKGKENDANGGPAPPKGESVKSVNGPPATGVSNENFDAIIHGLETRLGAVVTDTLRTSLGNLHGKIDENARVRDESFSDHQVKLLHSVSEVLNENTQKVLETLVHQQFADVVIPSISEKSGRAVDDFLQHKLQHSVTATVQKEIQLSLPNALNRSLRSSDFVNAISDRVTGAMTSTLQQEILGNLTQRLAPSLSSIATQTAQRVAGELHQQYHDQFEQMKQQHAQDANKIDQLLSYVSRLTDMVSTMAASQSSLQAEFLKLKQPPAELPAVGQSGQQPSIHQAPVNVGHNMGSQGYPSSMQSHRSSYPATQVPSQTAGHQQPQQYMGSPGYLRGNNSQNMPSPHGSAGPSDHVGPASSVNALAGAYANQMNKSEAEADTDLNRRIQIIEQAIQEGRLQDAMIQWIQSGREEEIFRRSLSRYPPNKFDNLPPLMLLVVIATISKELRPNPRLKEEVEWIEMAVRAYAENMPSYNWNSDVSREVMKSTSQTMQLLINRVQPLIAGLQDGFPTDPFLANLDRGKLEWIVRTSEHLLDTFTHGPRRYE